MNEKDKPKRYVQKGHRNSKQKDPDYPLSYLNDFLHYPPVKGFLQSIDDFFQNPFTHSPFRVSLEDHNNEYIITSELAGVKRDQIHIDIFRNQVVISIENKVEQTETNEEHGSYRKSISQRRDTRSVHLPKPVLDHKAKASYQDGLLKITLPIDKGHTLQID
ncbi:hypothetical protein AM500_10410 [Bacillus sp. FJAT-18017]|uniref:Hsp20/alpha crystallin family protein n=1 Tax=Bacillus sp. FJAT-18017 TaxID=1705566 RepID=UPI0006AF72DB|nr:Hsp20/alpha crystallin family protein [Bacillus sp. FJAT-18017]ALC90151.1 hypothetical protein AM500_10410 [Bacillus sp. FJAT-18017]